MNEEELIMLYELFTSYESDMAEWRLATMRTRLELAALVHMLLTLYTLEHQRMI